MTILEIPEKAVRIKLSGIVQGVGFRPFVYRLAYDCGLNGWVLNSMNGVEIHAQGPVAAVDLFRRRLETELPPAAHINSIQCSVVGCEDDLSSFVIRHSEENPKAAVDVIPSPDLALCKDCRKELLDPGDRRYRYPFINCTNCGPRFTIIQGLPYDRPRTTMRSFELCPECREEYENPLNRRFHAQPNACAECGPQLTLWPLAQRSDGLLHGSRALKHAVELLKSGSIIALKGLGGFHLACDATNDVAVARLRARKARPSKPFALMCRDLDTIRTFARVTPAEEKQLHSPAAPIVVLERKPSAPGDAVPSALVAPNQHTVGVMLPYTPLHVLVLGDGPAILVMTSANRSGLPLIIDDADAREELDGIADAVLGHDRVIEQRSDDSVLRVVDHKTVFFRRSRGFVPCPIELGNSALPRDLEAGALPAVLALGGELKNVFCLLGGNRAFLSQHIGDMDYEETHVAFDQALRHMLRLTRIRPTAIAYDPHPAYRINRWVEALQSEVSSVQTFAVQHHHAHMAACMAEHGLEGPVIGLVLDGTGYGSDGNLWGMELLTGDYKSYERQVHAPYVPLLGGESALAHPLRLAVAFVGTLLGQRGLEQLKALQLTTDERREVGHVVRLLESDLEWPQASSCGRLFDAVSALLGVSRTVTYEGQAAVELSELAVQSGDPDLTFDMGKVATVGTAGSEDRGLFGIGRLMAAVLGALREGVNGTNIACMFQNSLADLLANAVSTAADNSGLQRVVLSGGSFQNAVLLSRITHALEAKGLTVYSHQRVPPGDGGIALGQAVVARARLAASNPATPAHANSGRDD